MSTLGERIKSARGAASQEVFSRELNISKGSLGFYERNENLPNVDVILKICSKTGVSPLWLLLGEGPMRPTENAEKGTPLPQAAHGPDCLRCTRLEERLDKVEEERRELCAENRRLWKENAELRERCARYEEWEKQKSMLLLEEKEHGAGFEVGPENSA